MKDQMTVKVEVKASLPFLKTQISLTCDLHMAEITRGFALIKESSLLCVKKE